MIPEYLITFVSGMIAALISGLVLMRSSERRIQMENVTQERAKWRARIRRNALVVHQSASQGDLVRLQEMHAVFRTLLNPFDVEDEGILRSIRSMISNGVSEELLAEFSQRIAFLLKHDWERAKDEAQPWGFRLRTPRRVPYSSSKGKELHEIILEPAVGWEGAARKLLRVEEKDTSLKSIFDYFRNYLVTAGVIGGAVLFARHGTLFIDSPDVRAILALIVVLLAFCLLALNVLYGAVLASAFGIRRWPAVFLGLFMLFVMGDLAVTVGLHDRISCPESQSIVAPLTQKKAE